MGFHEPKRTQKTLNIFKRILYELKLALNELSIAFVVVKLKISNILRTHSASMK